MTTARAREILTRLLTEPPRVRTYWQCDCNRAATSRGRCHLCLIDLLPESERAEWRGKFDKIAGENT